MQLRKESLKKSIIESRFSILDSCEDQVLSVNLLLNGDPAIMSTICIGNPNLKHTVESRFFEPPGEKGIGLNYLGV